MQIKKVMTFSRSPKKQNKQTTRKLKLTPSLWAEELVVHILPEYMKELEK
jgi:hypothetical protein